MLCIYEVVALYPDESGIHEFVFRTDCPDDARRVLQDCVDGDPDGNFIYDIFSSYVPDDFFD